VGQADPWSTICIAESTVNAINHPAAQYGLAQFFRRVGLTIRTRTGRDAV